MFRDIGPRLGLNRHDVDVIVTMIEHHLLLPDVAMRRDISDEATIDLVAGLVGTVEKLELLDALTEADSKATGTSAWGSWKEQLIDELVSRTQARAGRRRSPPRSSGVCSPTKRRSSRWRPESSTSRATTI